MNFVDILIIGSGMSGLYSALKIKKYSPSTSFLILERYKEQWIGGRASNETFYGTEIVTGAGIGRLKKDKLLLSLVKSLHFPVETYPVNPQVSSFIPFVDVKKVLQHLKSKFHPSKHRGLSFEQFAKPILGPDLYKSFVLSSGYSDYEKEDAEETIQFYGMDDNACCWEAFHVPWREMVLKMYDKIGKQHFKFSSKVVNIAKVRETPCMFEIACENGVSYFCNRVIIGTTIDTTQKLLPQFPVYKDISGQPFLRLYGKFDKESAEILKELIKGFAFVSYPIQRMIPMDKEKGVYMIAYNDNKNAFELKDFLEDNQKNRHFFETLLEQTLNIKHGSLHLEAIKPFYWPIGTHFYKPLNTKLYKNREEFVQKAQNPENGILVVGEAVSRNQGWTEGALESVEAVVTRKWVQKECG